MAYLEAATYILSQIKGHAKPEVGIICGSGLSGLSDCLSDQLVLKYEDIPGFPRATVPGHAGELVFGKLNGIPCVCMKGRFHYYEGNTMEKVILPVRVMRAIGVKMLVVTNAAGGLNKEYNVGDIMVIQDHLGMPPLAGNHPLRGPNDEHLGTRFPSVTDAYDDNLQGLVMDAAAALNLSNKIRTEGCYCYVCGPSYESRAECRFLVGLGGDAVGMSTVPEVVAAHHCGIKVLGMSLITNKVVFMKGQQPANHAEVLEAVAHSGKNMENIVRFVVSRDRVQHILDRVPEFVWPSVAHKKNCFVAMVASGMFLGIAMLKGFLQK